MDMNNIMHIYIIQCSEPIAHEVDGLEINQFNGLNKRKNYKQNHGLHQKTNCKTVSCLSNRSIET